MDHVYHIHAGLHSLRQMMSMLDARAKVWSRPSFDRGMEPSIARRETITDCADVADALKMQQHHLTDCVVKLFHAHAF